MPLTYGRVLYLHLIEINPAFSGIIQNPFSLSVQCELMQSDLSYALLTAKPLPQLCDFPLFISPGELKIHIEVNVRILKLTKEELMKLRLFNTFVYSEILKILKDFLIFDNGADSGTIMLVPTRSGAEREIAFDVIDMYTKYNAVEEPTAGYKASINVTDETYLGHVVIPWYRMSDTVSIFH